MILCLLTDEPMHLHGVPCLTDVSVLLDLLQHLGVHSEWTPTSLMLQVRALSSTMAPYDIVSRMRASFWVLGPLLARYGQAKVSLPGGCAIGARPVDIYIKGLQAMGASIALQDGYILAQGQLHGASFRLVCPSVGATHVLMMAACLARGTTVLENVAREPEVVDVANCLVKMGACITGIGTTTLTIEGVETLKGATHTVIPDRIEACTYAMAGAITHGDITLTNVPLATIDAPLELLRSVGVHAHVTEPDTLRISAPNLLTAADVTTDHYPGFPTDLQAQFMTLMTCAHGHTRIVERIFENRFMHVQELARFGADISLHGDCAFVRGVSALEGAPVMASDLRASAALILAGLAANGETLMSRIYHLQRGFEQLEAKLQACGADIELINSDS